MERGRQSGSSDRSSGRPSGRPASGGKPSSSGRPGRPASSGTNRPASTGSARPKTGDRPASDRSASTGSARPKAGDRPTPSGRPVYGSGGRPISGGRPASSGRDGRPASDRSAPSGSARPKAGDRPTPSGRPVYGSGGRPISGGRPASSGRDGRPASDRSASTGSARPKSGDRSAPSGRPAYGKSERPSYSDRPASGGRPTTSGRPSSARPASTGSARPKSGDRSAPSGRPAYGKSERPSYSDRPASGGRPTTSGRPAPDRGGAWERTPLDRPRRVKIHEPNIPPEITGEELDRSIQRELSTLSPANAKIVAQHLVATGQNLDSNPKLALEHARAAVYHAGRIASVRESLGIAAYMCGEFAEALAEFRAAMRISGDVSNWSMMADCERGLGRPAKALAMAGAPEASKLDKAGQIELRIVAAGARRDLGQIEAALVTLTCPELNVKNAEWSGRLRYAYADALLASGREEEALLWFQNAAASDPEQLTDAIERVDQLNGISFDLDDGYGEDITNNASESDLED